MKVKTNLSASELTRVGNGLIKLAKSQEHSHPFTPENSAEKELLEDIKSIFDETMNNIKNEILETLVEK